jgi:rhodanese-related sulfurtransferase
MKISSRSSRRIFRDKKIIVGCQAGPRSSAAAGLLQQAGFQDVSNMLGGFGGMPDPMGNVERGRLGWLGTAGE